MDFSATSQYYVVGNDEGKALLYRYVYMVDNRDLDMLSLVWSPNTK